MCGGSGGDGGAADREAARQAQIRQGMESIDKTFGGFDDAYYGNIRQSYLDYVQPDFDRQYQDAQKQLAFQLARQGTTQSSTAAKRGADLEDEYQRQTLELQQNADNYANQRRAGVEDARNAVVAQLNSSADAGQAASLATNRAATLNELPKFDSLGNLFAAALGGLRTQAELESYGQSRYDVFGLGPRANDPNTGASRTVR